MAKGYKVKPIVQGIRCGERFFAVLLAALWMPSVGVGAMLDLTGDEGSGALGGAIFQRDHSHPTGTGVFDPFLTIDARGNSSTEQGYNTSGRPFASTMDNLSRAGFRSTDLRLGELGTQEIDGQDHFVFELDTNEPGRGSRGKSLSIDNIRIYTSPEGGQTPESPDELGTLRYGLNDLNDSTDWVKVDSSLGPTSGSGDSDLFVFIPTDNFEGADEEDFVYFYNANGGHSGSDSGTGAQAGFEEWRALKAEREAVPDGGTTALLLGLTMLGLAGCRRWKNGG